MDYNFDSFIRVSCVPLSSRSGRNKFKSGNGNLNQPEQIFDNKNEEFIIVKPHYSYDTFSSTLKHSDMVNRSPNKRFGNDVRKEAIHSSRTSRSQNWDARAESTSVPRSSSQGSTYKHLRSKDLEKMRADLDTITNQLTQIEKNLPSLAAKTNLRKQETVKKDDVKRSPEKGLSSFNEPYNASEFNEEARKRSSSAGGDNFYSKLSSSLADNYDKAVMRGIQTTNNRGLVSMIQRELEEWRSQNSKNVSLQTEDCLKRVETVIADGHEQKDTENFEPSKSIEPVVSEITETLRAHPPAEQDRPLEMGLGTSAPVGAPVPEPAYPLDRYLYNNPALSLDKPSTPRFEMHLPYSPSEICRQTSEDIQIIEKTAQLLKEVEQHWKKSMFHPHNPIPSPNSLSDSLNDSECENYIERLAAVHFNKAIHKQNPQVKGGSTKQSPRGPVIKGQKHFCGRKYIKDDTSLFSYEEKRSYYRFEPREPRVHHEPEGKSKKCHRCTAALEVPRCQLGKGKPGAIAVLPKQQYVLKKTPRRSYGRSVTSGGSLQPSPRDSRYPVRESRSSSDIPSPIKFTPRSHLFGVDKAEVATNTDQRLMNTMIVNVTSSAPDPPQLFPKPQKNRIVVQQLPQVDIRPELTKQVGPSINITVSKNAVASSKKDTSNIAVFSCVHSTSTDRNTRNVYTNMRNIAREKNCDVEEAVEKSLAARLELRSVAENFLYRLQSEPMPSGCSLVDTLYNLVDLINSSIEAHLKGHLWENPGELPLRLEMVSDLLSDELKTWGAQSKDHYLRIESIVKNLILDIQISLNSKSDFTYTLPGPASTNDLPKCKYLRSPKGTGRQVDKSKSKEVSPSRSAKDLTLAQKLLEEKSQKVKRLEKIYRTNCELKMNRKRQTLDRLKSDSVSEGSLNGIEKDSEIKTAVEDSDSETSGNIIPPICVFSDKDIESEVEENLENPSENQLKITIPREKKTSESYSEGSFQDNPEENESVSSDEDFISEKVEPSKEKIELKLNETYVKVPTEKDSPNSENNNQIQEVFSDYEDDWEAEDTSINQHSHQSKNEDTPDLNKNNIKAITNSILTPRKQILQKKIRVSDKASSPIHKKNNAEICLETPSEKNRVASAVEAHQSTFESVHSPLPIAESSNNRVDLIEHNFRGDLNESRFNPDCDPLQIFTLNNAQSETLIELKVPKAKENQENVVKLHSKSKTSEIKLSYVQSKRLCKDVSEISSSDSSPSIKSDKTKGKSFKRQEKGDLINEKMRLEELSSNIFKNMFEEKINAILTKYAELNLQKQIQGKEASTSESCRCSSAVTAEVSKPEIKFEIVNVCREPGEISVNHKSEDNLKSPSVKLQIDNRLITSESINDVNLKPSSKDSCVQTEENETINAGLKKIKSKIKVDSAENRNQNESGLLSPVGSEYSEDARSLINLVYDLDSSDSKTTEESNQERNQSVQLQSISTQTGKHIAFHRFNSDEFLIYPRLNPQPLNVQELKTLNPSKNEPFFLETITGLREVDITPENQIFNELEHLHPSPEEVLKPQVNETTVETLKSTKTQTVNESPTTFRKILKDTPNLVEHMDLSWSQGSSNHDSPRKSNKIIIGSQSSVRKDKKQEELVLPQIDLSKISVTENVIDNSANKQKKEDIQLPSSKVTSKEKIVSKRQLSVREPAQNKTAVKSSSTSDTDSSYDEASLSESSTNASCKGSSQLMRVLENVKYAEQVFDKTPPYETSSESSTSEEWMREITDEDNDPLADLPQLMNYLESYKSPRFGTIRLRHCTRHTGAYDHK